MGRPYHHSNCDGNDKNVYGIFAARSSAPFSGSRYQERTDRYTGRGHSQFQHALLDAHVESVGLICEFDAQAWAVGSDGDFAEVADQRTMP